MKLILRLRQSVALESNTADMEACDVCGRSPKTFNKPASRRVRHGEAFAFRDGFSTPLDWCSFGAPVAQGIERSPAEAEVACSNHAGRTPPGNPPRCARHDDFPALVLLVRVFGRL